MATLGYNRPSGDMHWLTVTWSMTASACVTLAMVHLVVWLSTREDRTRGRAHLLFSIAAIAVAGVAWGELNMLRARTPEAFGEAMRWAHLSVFFMLVSILWFVHVYFGTGRTWLAWTVTGVRAVIVIVNFIVTPNVNYSRITSVERIPIWGGEHVAIATGVISPWTRLAQVGSVLFLWYVIDASVKLWRRGKERGDAVEQRRAIGVGGSIAFFIFAAAFHGALVQQQIVRTPYLISLPFLVPLAVMAYQLGADVVGASRLSRELAASRSQLHEVGERMELAAGAAELGFWEWDVGQDVVWANPRCRQMFGFRPDETLDLEQALRTVHTDDRDAVRAAMMRALKHGGDYEAQYRVVHPDGRTRWIAARGRVDVTGDKSHVLLRGVAFDQTERRLAELESVKQRNELAHLSRVTTLGELSGSLAHELNQPLTAILSNAQAAQRFLAFENPDLAEVRSILTDIVSEDKRAGEVIHRLRLLFKKGEVQRELLDANDLVREVLKFLNSDLVNNDVTVTAELMPDLPPIHGDRVQMQQVLINLFLNACDALMDVGIDQRQLNVRSSRNGGEGVEISVTDRGCGIPPDRLETIFEPFVSTKGKGMGLGLAVCRTIVQAHGGKLWAMNNSDRGATFSMRFPDPTGGQS